MTHRIKVMPKILAAFKILPKIVIIPRIFRIENILDVGITPGIEVISTIWSYIFP